MIFLIEVLAAFVCVPSPHVQPRGIGVTPVQQLVEVEVLLPSTLEAQWPSAARNGRERPFNYTGVFDTWLWGRLEIFDLRPGNSFPKVGREAPHILEGVSGRPAPPQTPKSTISGQPKNHVLF